jgi:hypothetical protein
VFERELAAFSRQRDFLRGLTRRRTEEQLLVEGRMLAVPGTYAWMVAGTEQVLVEHILDEYFMRQKDGGALARRVLGIESEYAERAYDDHMRRLGAALAAQPYWRRVTHFGVLPPGCEDDEDDELSDRVRRLHESTDGARRPAP